jgi:hypothetical protein
VNVSARTSIAEKPLIATALLTAGSPRSSGDGARRTSVARAICLHLGEDRADADVRPVAEGDVRVRAPGEAERAGIAEHLGVAVRGRHHAEDGVPGGDDLAVNINAGKRRPGNIRGRSPR